MLCFTWCTPLPFLMGAIAMSGDFDFLPCPFISIPFEYLTILTCGSVIMTMVVAMIVPMLLTMVMTVAAMVVVMMLSRYDDTARWYQEFLK